MSTPVAAGNAVLVRQYFMDPKFWKAFCNPSYRLCQLGSFSPKGSLIKALLLHSGDQMSLYNGVGTVSGRVALGDIPDVYQGYGRVNLQNILAVQKNDQLFTLFVDEGKLSQLSELQYYIQVVSANVPLKMTVSWYDPPNEIFVAKCLVHDLDLILNDPMGNIFYGNSHNSDGVPLSGSSRDELNNNEHIHIKAPTIGNWIVRIQSKSLTESIYQNFSLVITADGLVTPDPNPSPISPMILRQCQTGSGAASSTPKLDVDVSLYSRVLGDGWTSFDSYTITEMSNGNVYSGSFNERHLYYKVDSPCLEAGCYKASLNMNGGSHSARGMQMSIAQCGVYLAQLAPVQSFCINHAVPYPNTFANETLEIFPKGACVSECHHSNHLNIPLILFEGEGAGWSGSYYFVTPLDSILHQTGTVQSATVAVGNLEWGFMKTDNVCLPIQRQCYRLQISYPSDTEDFPEMKFPNSYFIDDSLGNRVIHRNKECPYEMNTTVPLAQFCIEDDLEKSYVEFFVENTIVPDFGQLSETWHTLILIQSDATKIGTCTLNVSQVIHLNSYNAPPLSQPISSIPSPSPTITISSPPSDFPSEKIPIHLNSPVPTKKPISSSPVRISASPTTQVPN